MNIVNKLRHLGAGLVQLIDREISYYFPSPRSATLSLTERCNLKCRACGVWKKSSRINDELDTKTIFRVLKELKDFGVKKIYLIEGEPLLRSDIVEIVKEINRLGMVSDMTTNGTLLNAKLSDELIEAGLNTVAVSIDAPNEKHDELRGIKGTFEKAVSGVHGLTDARKRKPDSKLEIFINSLITSETVEFLDDWLDFAKNLGIDGINFLNPVFVPKEVDDEAIIDGKKVSSGRFIGLDASLILNKKDFPGLLKKIENMRKQGDELKISVWISPDMSFLDSNIVQYERGVLGKCYITRNSLIINPYGEIIPCPFLENYSYGSVKEKILREIWDNPRHRLLMGRLKQGFRICGYCRSHFAHNLGIGQLLRRKF